MKKKYLVPLLKTEQLAPGAFLQTYDQPEIAASARPGQFVNILPSASTDPLLRRPFSICTTDRDRGHFTVLIKVIGPGTRAIVDTRNGSQVDMLAPLGLSFDWEAGGAVAEPGDKGEREKMILVAGGVGVAPLLMLCEEARAETDEKAKGDPPEIIFCYGARTAEEFVLLNRIEPLVDKLVLTTDDGSRGTKEFCTQAAERHFSPGCRIFTCGPNPMMNDLLTRMRAADLEGQVSLENQMGCGIGACLGCVVTTREGYVRICCDGPVLKTKVLDSIGW